MDNGWLSSNTDSLTPTVAKIVDVKVIDTANQDYIFLYEVDEPIDFFGLGAVDFQHSQMVSIDIRSTYLRSFPQDIRAHIIKVKDEVIRILKANISDPDSYYHLLTIIRKRDLSDKSVALGRFVIDIKMQHWGA